MNNIEALDQDIINVNIDLKRSTLLLDTVMHNTTNIDLWHKLAKEYEAEESYEEAEWAYKKLIERKDNFNDSLYFSLGHILTLQNKHEEASLVFKEQRIMRSAYGISQKEFKNNTGIRRVSSYCEYYKNLDVISNTVIYESFRGSGMSCNPYAIFISLLDDPKFKDWKHIWVISDKESIDEKYKTLDNIIFIERNSDAYLRYLATCEYLINNSSFPMFFIRKPNQKYLNTWHGTPLKKLGIIDVKEPAFQGLNTARNFLQSTHMISPNKHSTNIITKKYGTDNILSCKVSETGYPRIDLILNTNEKRKEELYKKLDIDITKPILIYAPTYRGIWDNPEVETDKLVNDLKNMKSDKYNLVFRGHYFAENIIKELNLPISVAPHNIDSCELLSIADILITDYSSIFYDFLPTNKPIIHYVYDYELYSEKRGMYFTKDELPGVLCYTIDELLKVLNNLNTKKVEKLSPNYLVSKEKFALYEDGNSTKRVIDFFFFDKIKNINLVNNTKKKSILLYAPPFNSGDLTASLIKRVNSIDKNLYSITIVVEKNTLFDIEEAVEKVYTLNSHINLLIRDGRMVTTIEEKWIRDKVAKYKYLEEGEMLELYKKTFSREFIRIFGDTKYDYIIDYHGYNPFWTALFAFSNQKNKIIYLHEDMHEEMVSKFPNLERTLHLYQYFDKLISKSSENEVKLKERYGIRDNSFISENNFFNLL